MTSRVRKEIELSLTGIGYEYEMDETGITLYPDKLTDKSSSILGEVRNLSSKVATTITVSKENEHLKAELLARINRMLTPIKLRVIGNLVLIFVYITILSFMLEHIWNHFFSIIPVSIFITLIAFLVIVFIKLLFDVPRSDFQLLSRGKYAESDGKYVIGYSTFYRALKTRKLWSILFSAILLASFLSGIIFNSGLLNYISEVSDALGYVFAIMFLTLSKLRTRLPTSVFILIFLFVLFEVKTITNSYILNYIFLAFDALIYIPFFIYSLYDLLTFKEPSIDRPDTS